MQKSEILKRYILLIIGTILMAFGIAFTKHGGLGVSPVSSVPNVLSYKFTFLSMGNWLSLFNCLLVIFQIIILRKEFRPIQLLQIPLSFVLGWLTDFGLWVISPIATDLYIKKLLCVAVGLPILGAGVATCFMANVTMSPGEAFVKVVAGVLKKDFGNVKIAIDIFWVSLSVVLSLIFFNFSIVGTREGTIISALCTGLFVKLFMKLLKKPISALLCEKKM